MRPCLLLQLRFVQGLLALVVFVLFILVPLQQVQAQGQLLIQAQERGSRFAAQFIEGVDG
ncbi:hypothetical protein D3C77_453770 [compost metagenome]